MDNFYRDSLQPSVNFDDPESMDDVLFKDVLISLK